MLNKEHARSMCDMGARHASGGDRTNLSRAFVEKSRNLTDSRNQKPVVRRV